MASNSVPVGSTEQRLPLLSGSMQLNVSNKIFVVNLIPNLIHSGKNRSRPVIVAIGSPVIQELLLVVRKSLHSRFDLLSNIYGRTLQCAPNPREKGINLAVLRHENNLLIH